MKKRILRSSVLIGLTLLSISSAVNAKADKTSKNKALLEIDADHKSDAGRYFIQDYQTNTSANTTPETNASIDLLSQMNKLWQPGSDWNNGKRLNTKILDENIDLADKIAKTRTKAEEDQSWLDDKNDMDYSVQEGLGNLTDYFRKEANITGGYTSVPSDAETKDYDTNWDKAEVTGDTNSSLGNVVKLADTLKDGNYSSSSSSKKYFKYPRPFRWDGTTVTNAQDNGVIIPTLKLSAKADPVNDYGFPSGHTNSSYLTAYALAYAYPQKFQSLLTRASEVGNNRIVAGRHSPLDVIGGRVLGTALAAAILNDPANAQLKADAFKQAQSVLKDSKGDDNSYGMDNSKKNSTKYNYRLTYGFSKIANSKHTYVVPKGAEVLLETRLPYLSATQRRAVLATTELPTGYPILDDGEGWGRLNLYNAANGYGQLVSDTTVKMDASKGGFNASDTWSNDITGVGKLTKTGTGSLQLTGKNTYKGGVAVKDGSLVAASNDALGTGDVAVNGGNLKLSAKKVTVKGAYKQSSKGTTSLAKDGRLVVKKGATLGGTLKLDGGKFKSGDKIMSYTSHKGKFSKVTGLSHGLHIIYNNHDISIAKK
ncbi:phosphatase PAP2 family protein [Lactobacillus sp. Sy-1]|uniref:phosphatase PAP2 family protein n=1 Tax=Lactobacillus sp. Sy-1 TaxID=2109645 RepID=UPI001C5B5243|nr:phosphatase PAP2 family protein [Lactobacillus sp. Sy-1]MBW1606133.1 phosphatase PAP2 family protein [Lactobacillus sp. Sy-1]